jgi:uncharacterized protein YbjT (DUF2867 family)
MRFLRYHAAVEDAVQRSGIDWTFLRPKLFMRGLLQIRQMIQATGTFAAAVGSSQVSVVDARDNAAATFAALTEEGPASRAYDLTGPEALTTHTEMAKNLSHTI